MSTTPPVICRECKSIITGQHTLNDCTSVQADLALDMHKAERRNREEQAMAMRLQRRYQDSGLGAI